MSDKTIPCVRLGGNSTWELPTILGTLRWDGKQFTMSPIDNGDKIPDGVYSVIQFKNGLPVKGGIRENPGYTPPDCGGTAGGCGCSCGGGGGAGSVPDISETPGNLLKEVGDGLLATVAFADSATIKFSGDGTGSNRVKAELASKPQEFSLSAGPGIDIPDSNTGIYVIGLKAIDPSPAATILGMEFDQYGRLISSNDDAKNLEARLEALEAKIEKCVQTDDTDTETTGITKINLRNSDGALIATDQSGIDHAVENGQDGTIIAIKQVS